MSHQLGEASVADDFEEAMDAGFVTEDRFICKSAW